MLKLVSVSVNPGRKLAGGRGESSRHAGSTLLVFLAAADCVEKRTVYLPAYQPTHQPRCVPVGRRQAAAVVPSGPSPEFRPFLSTPARASRTLLASLGSCLPEFADSSRPDLYGHRPPPNKQPMSFSQFDLRLRARRLGLLLAAGLLASTVALAQPATPHRAVTDGGGGNLRGISGFELFREGIYWWKSGGQNNDATQREGTLAVNSNLGIRPPLTALAPASRYIGQGYGFSLDGAVRDDLFVYYAANGYLRRKPLAASFSDALANSTRIMVERIVGTPPRFELAPVAANGAVLLWRGEVWGSYATRGEFVIERPSNAVNFHFFSAAGEAVKRMAAIQVLKANGSPLKESLLVLTQDRLLYQFDLDPFNSTPALLARNVWDFAVRNESTRGVGGGADVELSRNYTTAIYAAVGDLSSTRVSGRLLRFSARDRSSSVEYDTHTEDIQVRGVAATADRIYLTVTPLRCGGVFGCSFDTPNAQILSRLAPANSDFGQGTFGTIADKLTAGGSLEGFNLRSDRRWLYWITGDSVWRIPADAQSIERDFEVLGLEVVQTTQDFDNSTRLAANKPTVARVYARLAKDTTGVGRYAVNGLLRGYAGDTALAGSPLSPVNNPTITSTGNLGTLRSGVDNGFLFQLPNEWIQRGRFRVEFTLNPAMGVPETGPNPLGNNVLTSGNIEVVQTGSPCLVFVPVHTAAPNYDPRDPASGFGDILARAQSLLPVDHFRFVLKGDRISRPVPKIKISKYYIPYPAIDYEPFDVSGGFDDALYWLKIYSSFESNPRDCGDTHYVGTVHWMANTSSGGSTSLGLATRPNSGVAEDLVVKMEPPGSVSGNQAWDEPRGGETLAHELGHNYTLQHIDQSMSPLGCGGGRPLRAGPYPLDSCTIGIVSAANLAAELADRTTQYGFDPRTYSVLSPTNAADLMSYRSSTWTSKPSLDALFDRIPGARGPALSSLAGAGDPPIPGTVVMVNGTLDLRLNTAVLRPCYRLPASTFDPAKLAASLNPPPVTHDWRIRWADAVGTAIAEFPLVWDRTDDGDGQQSFFVQFIPDQPGAVRLQILKGGVVVTEYQPSPGSPTVKLVDPVYDAANHRLTAAWTGSDPEQDPLSYTLQFSADGGASWETLQVGYPDEAFATNTRLLPGGNHCRLRVIATDGFNAGVAESASFSLPLHAPDVSIGGLREGERLPFGTTPTVTAVGYDAEDGSLDPARLQWRLEGAEVRTETGSTLSLRDLPPGAYTLEVLGTDSDQESGRATVHFEIEPIVIPTAAAPILDGNCGDAAYAGAPLIRLALSNGGFVNARMVHADGALHACVSDLRFSGSGTAPTTVGLRVDRRANRDVPATVADLAGFFVDEFGIPSELLGDTPATPESGFIAVISRGDSSWSAELRIPEALLGGWDRQSPLVLVHSNPVDPTTTRWWPSGASESQPDSWAAAALGTSPLPANRPPVAVAHGPASPVAATGKRVYLDGNGSSDPDGDAIAFEWTQTAGPAVTLDNPTAPIPSFAAEAVAAEVEIQFRLVVRDAALESAPVIARVTLLPAAVPAEPDPTGLPPRTGPPGEGLAFTLLWPGSPGDRCALQSSVNLVDWDETGVLTADFLGRLRFTALATDSTQQRFYRAVGTPEVIHVDPQGALAFDGIDDAVVVAHRAELNAYPLTVAAWIQTSRNDAVVDGIVSKYVDGSFNGYGLFVYKGRLRAFYFASPGSSIWGGGQGLDAGPIADGQWHHVALVVDAAGGRLVVDGKPAAALPWVGPPGPPTTTAPLNIGHYHTYPNSFLGKIDEVVLWNVARSSAEIALLGGQRIAADDLPRPLALWHFDEQEGLSTVDATSNGLVGILRGGVNWSTSEVPKP